MIASPTALRSLRSGSGTNSHKKSPSTRFHALLSDASSTTTVTPAPSSFRPFAHALDHSSTRLSHGRALHVGSRCPGTREVPHRETETDAVLPHVLLRQDHRPEVGARLLQDLHVGLLLSEP